MVLLDLLHRQLNAAKVAAWFEKKDYDTVLPLMRGTLYWEMQQKLILSGDVVMMYRYRVFVDRSKVVENSSCNSYCTIRKLTKVKGRCH